MLRPLPSPRRSRFGAKAGAITRAGRPAMAAMPAVVVMSAASDLRSAASGPIVETVAPAMGPTGNQGEQPAGERRPRPERREAQGEGGRPQNRPPRGPGRGEERRDDRRGPRPDKRQDNRSDNRRDGGHERREKQPDPNSPFAKLLALKAQLEDSKK